MTQSQPSERKTQIYRSDSWGLAFPPFPALIPKCGWEGEYGLLELSPEEQNKPPGAGLQKLLETFKCHTVPLNNIDSSVGRNESSPSSHQSPRQPRSGSRMHHSFPLPTSQPGPLDCPLPSALWDAQCMGRGTRTPGGGETKGRPPAPCHASQEDRTKMKAS